MVAHSKRAPFEGLGGRQQCTAVACGAGCRAVRAAAEHALANGIHRVEAHVRLGNTASERVLERVGFEREGVKRRYLRHEGVRVDATLFALLADD